MILRAVVMIIIIATTHHEHPIVFLCHPKLCLQLLHLPLQGRLHSRDPFWAPPGG